MFGKKQESSLLVPRSMNKVTEVKEPVSTSRVPMVEEEADEVPLPPLPEVKVSRQLLEIEAYLLEGGGVNLKYEELLYEVPVMLMITPEQLTKITKNREANKIILRLAA